MGFIVLKQNYGGKTCVMSENEKKEKNSPKGLTTAKEISKNPHHSK